MKDGRKGYRTEREEMYGKGKKASRIEGKGRNKEREKKEQWWKMLKLEERDEGKTH